LTKRVQNQAKREGKNPNFGELLELTSQPDDA
jgi:hypothetical protein